MIQLQLFLGIPLDQTVERALARIDPKVRDYFIGDNSKYLQKTQRGDQAFLGKFLGSTFALEESEVISSHLKSLFSRLFSDELELNSLKLIAIAKSDNSSL